MKQLINKYENIVSDLNLSYLRIDLVRQWFVSVFLLPESYFCYPLSLLKFLTWSTECFFPVVLFFAEDCFNASACSEKVFLFLFCCFFR